jgi:hypothetical protein
MACNKSNQSNKTFSAKKHSQTQQQNNSSYQSLYLWTSFLLRMISLGIIVWQRSSGSVMSSNSAIRNDKVFNRDDNFIITYSTPLILSALTYQQSGSVTSGLLVGLGTYFTQVKAQPTVPALNVNLNNLARTEGVIFTGAQYTGQSVYAADVNKDGKMDLLIGAIYANKVYLVYGSNFNLTNLDNLGEQGVIFTGDLYTGSSVYAADINQDGHIDVLIGANTKVYLVYGPVFNMTNLDNLSTEQGVVFTGKRGTGISLYAIDINGDMHLDILIGAYSSNKTYLAYGPKFNVTDLDALNGEDGVVFTGDMGTGTSVYATDVNNDKKIDILIGAANANKVYLVYGSAFNVTDLDALNVQQGVIFTGSANTGYSVYAADMNQDGNIDILIGAYGANKAYLIYGATFNETNLDNLNNQQGVIFSGGEYTGVYVYAADLNQDRNMDILVSASNIAKTYLVYGPNFANATNLEAIAIKQGVIFTGGHSQASYVADMDGDGSLDIIMGAESDNKTYIVYNQVFNLFPLATVATPLPMNTLTTANQKETNSNVVTATQLSSIESTVPKATTTLKQASSTTTENSNVTRDIIGAAIGGFTLAACLGAIGFYAYRKKSNTNESTKASSVSEDISLQDKVQDRNIAMQENYRKIDEIKKTEEQYDDMPKLEI